MYALQRFAGRRFERINALLEAHSGLLRWHIHLVASGSYPFPECMKAMSAPFQVFPCEGFPGKRFHPGNQVLDEIEILAEERLRELFGFGKQYRATIQPHACTQANQIVFNAVLGPESRVISLAPSHGGHISHTVLVGRRNQVDHYEVDHSGYLDYEAIAALAQELRPDLIVSGASSYPREIEWRRLRAVCDEVGAHLLADISHTALYIMTSQHEPVFPYADFATFSMVKTLRGPNSGVLIYRREYHSKVAAAVFPGTQGGPQENVMFAKLVALEQLRAGDATSLAKRTIDNARVICSRFEERGLHVVTGGTDGHQVLVDLTDVGLTGAEAERRCEAIGVLVNRNMIPGDRKGPRTTSGIRLGSAAVTSLGCGHEDMLLLADVVADMILHGRTDSLPQLDAFRRMYHHCFNDATEAADQAEK